MANRARMTTSPSEGPSRSMGHIPTLDGWRGIAILMVLYEHLSYALTGGPNPRPSTVLPGEHGVTLFFVLSGFLITSNLLRQPISLGRFYIRRFFRLLPTAWLFLCTVLLLDWGFGIHLTSWSEVLGCLFLYRNFQGFAPGGGSGVACHFWSLSIEEQFYLIWPSLLLLFGARRCKWIAGLGAAASVAFRYVLWDRYLVGTLWTRTEVHTDALLTGCLLALLLAEGSRRDQVARISKWLAAPAVFAFVLACCLHSYHHLQPGWECAAIAALLAYTSLHPRALLGRVLDWKPLAFLGTVSYSVYIWQEIFMQFRSGIALTVALCLGLPYVALASYYLVERPMRRFGRRLTEGVAERPAYSGAGVAFGRL